MIKSEARRTFLVTGGHGGLGFQCARTLARDFGAELVLAGRDLPRVEAAANEIRREFNAKVSAVQVDLGALADVRAAADEIKRRVESGEIAPLHGIVCNAGLMAPTNLVYSKDGIEQTFAVNHLGHFLLVEMLLPILSTPGRIVVVSSDTHDPKTLGGRMGKPVIPDASFLAYPEKQGVPSLTPMQRYATSKVCNILFAYELNRRIRQSRRDIAVLAFNPGFTPGTGFTRSFNGIAKTFMASKPFAWMIGLLGGVMGDRQYSGDAMGQIAGDPRYQSKSGTYFECHNFALHERSTSTASYDEALARTLWSDSAQLAGIS